MSDGRERRRHTRVPLNMLVQLRLGDMDEFMREVAANISAGGMFVRTQTPNPVDSMLYFQLGLRDGSNLIEGLGKVVHVNPPDHEVPGMGIEFVNLDEGSRRLVDEIVADRAGD